MAYAMRRPVRQRVRHRPPGYGGSSFGGGGFFDIVCPPGGRLIIKNGVSPVPPKPKTQSPEPRFQIKVNQGKSRHLKVSQGKKNFWEGLILCLIAVPRLAQSKREVTMAEIIAATKDI